MQCIKLPAANACIFKRIEGPSNALSFGLSSIYRKRTRFPETKWVSGCTGDSDYKFPFVAGKRNVVRSDARVSRRTVVIPRLRNPVFNSWHFSARWNNYAMWNPCNCVSFQVRVKQCSVLDAFRTSRNVKTRKREAALFPFCHHLSIRQSFVSETA